MNTLVCVRSVPDPESVFRPLPDGSHYDDSGLRFKVNDYDLVAMEAAVLLREQAGGEITAVTAGPARAEEQLRKAMGMGADHGFLIEAADSLDAMVTASLIADWARPRGFDLVLCGVMSEDLGRCQTGPALAALLDYPSATTVVSMSLDQESGLLDCERELEGGDRELARLRPPALVTVQSGLNQPRYPSLSNVLRVRKLDIPRIKIDRTGPPRRGQGDTAVSIAEGGGGCEFLSGTDREIARALIGRIRANTRTLG